MTREDKKAAIAELKDKFEAANFFYITDSSALSVEKVNELRGMCFEKGIEMKVVKNTVAQKALEAAGEERGFAPLMESLKGPTALMFSEVANSPAKVIKEFRKSNDKPILKAAYIDTAVYMGDDQVEALSALKSKEELIGEVILLLQSPAKNVISGLKSGGATIAGLVKTLADRPS